MSEENNNYIKYYNWLVKTFGHITCRGCSALAHIIADYTENMTIQELYEIYAEDNGCSANSVKFNVNDYIKQIQEDHDINDFAEIFDYKFKPNQTRITPVEFIMLTKFKFDNM